MQQQQHVQSSSGSGSGGSSPWQVDSMMIRNNGNSSINGYDFIERSMSAPPPETSFLFQSGGGTTMTTTQQFPNNNNYHQQRALHRRVVDNGSSNSNYEDILDRNIIDDQQSSPETLFLDSIKDPRPNILHRQQPNPTLTRSPPPPGFSPNFLSSTNNTGDDDFVNLSSFDRRLIGENLVRSQSAAPSIDAGSRFLSSGTGGSRTNDTSHQQQQHQQQQQQYLFGVGGLANRETPVVSNRTDNRSNSNDIGGGIDSYLESNLSDRSHLLQLGQRRPASTGIIGDHHHHVNISSSVLESLGLVGGISSSNKNSHSNSNVGRPLQPQTGTTVRPAPKTLMDLIQEELPPESPFDGHGGGGGNDIYSQDFQRGTGFGLDRPRTTSPMSSSINYQRDQQYHQRQEQNHTDLVSDPVATSYPRQRVIDQDFIIRGGNVDQYQISRVGGNDNYSPQRYYDQNIVQSDNRRLPTEYVFHQNEDSNRIQRSQYAPLKANLQPSRPRPLRPGQHAPPVQFDQQGPFYGESLQHSQIQVHVLPNGQTVYVHSSPPQGFATPQYPSHSQLQQQQHVRSNTFSNGMSIQNDQQQQYIPAVPVQRNGSPNRNSYTYIQTQNDPYSGPHQPVTNIPGGNANTVHVRSAYAGQSFPPQQQVQQRQPQQHHHQSTSSQASGGGRGGKEKSGRNNRRSGNNINNVGNPQQRRSGGSDSRNSGADGNHSPSQTDIGSHSLLEDFKEKKNSRDWTVKDIKGHVVDFCQDQNGSRFVQQRLEVGDAAEKAIAMTEVLPAIRALRNDVFGNYVVQKLLDFGSPTMKEQIRVTMTGEMVELSVQMYGCRVVQKALESLDEASLPKLLEEFHNNVLSLIHDQNGNHVIQKCIEIISQKAKQARNDGDDAKAAFFNEQIDFIVDDVMMNLASLACHPYGCRVLQRILEHCTEEKKNFVLDELRPSHRRLLDDQYGNYVIQHVLQFGRVEDRDLVLAVVVENGLLKLSKQKFASNVVEKLLKYGNAEQRKAVAREMLKLVDEDTDEVVTNGGHGTSVVLLMVRDAYANYVVQTTIDVVPPQSRERKKLVEELNKHSTELKNYTFAKHIVSKLTS